MSDHSTDPPSNDLCNHKWGNKLQRELTFLVNLIECIGLIVLAAIYFVQFWHLLALVVGRCVRRALQQENMVGGI